MFKKDKNDKSKAKFNLNLGNGLKKDDERDNKKDDKKGFGDSEDSKTSSSPSSSALQPFVSPSYEDVPMWNILPSYQLYESTFSKTINPTDEDFRYNPPSYETASPLASPSENGSDPTSATNEYFPTTSGCVHVPQNVNDSPTWENSILGNTHRMRRLDAFNQRVTSDLRIDIQITDEPCRIGVPHRPVDVLTVEFQQGDNVSGYILVKNMGKERISFDMFSVVFEGKESVMGDVNDSKKPLVFHKFLNVFDYNASWTPASISDDSIDPADGIHLGLRWDKYFEPGVTYKKFFNFKFPERLLDCSCETHLLQKHAELFPTIGLARDQFMQNIKKFRERNLSKQKGSADFSLMPIRSPTNTTNNNRKPGLDFGERIKDLSFPDTAISYSIEVRVVGKASDYPKVFPKIQGPDEFIIVEEQSQFLRVIPRERLSYEIESEVLDADSKLLYNNLVNRVKEKIKLGNDLLEKEDSNQDAANALERTLSISKRKQLYVDNSGRKSPREANRELGMNAFLGTSSDNNYVKTVPIRKKQNLTSVPKIVGVFEVNSPKLLHKIKYVSPFNSERNASKRPLDLTTKLSIPLELIYKPSCKDCKDYKTSKPPDIKAITAEVVVFTYRSKKYPIPIEITPDMVYKNIREDQPDTFETHIVKPFKKYLQDLTILTKKLNHEVLQVDSQLIMDMKALVDVSSKYHNLKIEDIQIDKKHDWTMTSNQEGDSLSYRKTVNISLDLKKLLTKEFAKGSHEDLQKGFFVLVPNFQSCILGRLYFIHINVKLYNNESVCFRVPLTIEA